MSTNLAARIRRASSFNQEAIDHDKQLTDPDYLEMCDLLDDCLQAAKTVEQYGAERDYIKNTAINLDESGLTRLTRRMSKCLVRDIPGTQFSVDPQGCLYTAVEGSVVFSGLENRYVRKQNVLAVVSYRAIRELSDSNLQELRHGLRQIQ